MTALITYRTSTQKNENGFRSVITPDILTDICRRLTGQTQYSVNELTDSYNKGRLLTLKHDGIIHYVSVFTSPIEISV